MTYPQTQNKQNRCSGWWELDLVHLKKYKAVEVK